MTIHYSDGRVYQPDATVTPRKGATQKRERRKTEPGESTDTQVTKPPKDSPLWTFSAICSSTHGPDAVAFIKFPCEHCLDLTSKSANCVIVWHGTWHRIWCVCQVSKMSSEEMKEAAA